MPFTAATITAFWTDLAQMGISDRTRTQMGLEGLTSPADFEDFPAKEDLEALFKLLMKPAKIPNGIHGALLEIASYVIPAKSQIRIDGARLLVLYYKLVGRPLEPDDMLWPVIRNFVEQWKALMEKKKAEVGPAPRLTKDKPVYKWLEQMSQHLGRVIGVRNTPFTYLIRPDVQPPANLGARAVDQPYTEEYESIEREMTLCVTHNHTLGRSDNSALFQILETAIQGHDVSATIAPFKRTQDGRGAYNAINDQHANKGVWDRVVKEANDWLVSKTWTGTTSITLLQHTAMQRKAFVSLTEAAYHVPTVIPGPRQRVTLLLDSLKTENPKMLAGTAAIEQDEPHKRQNFESAVSFLLPFCPVADKNVRAKGLGVKVSGAAAEKPAGGVSKGTTGVELRWHEPKIYATLPKEQKKELQAWASTQPKREGGRKRTAGKTKFEERRSKKAKIASTKATTTLMEAMTESHNAQMELMNARISSMSSGGVPMTLPPAPAVKVGSAVGFHPGYSPPPVYQATDPRIAMTNMYGPPPVFQPNGIAVHEERARVAAVNLKNILKPPSKKTAP
jgi:hypothetical protein